MSKPIQLCVLWSVTMVLAMLGYLWLMTDRPEHLTPGKWMFTRCMFTAIPVGLGLMAWALIAQARREESS